MLNCIFSFVYFFRQVVFRMSPPSQRFLVHQPLSLPYIPGTLPGQHVGALTSPTLQCSLGAASNQGLISQGGVELQGFPAGRTFSSRASIAALLLPIGHAPSKAALRCLTGDHSTLPLLHAGCKLCDPCLRGQAAVNKNRRVP